MYTCRLLPKFRISVIIISPFLIHKLHYMSDFKRSYWKHASWLNFQSSQNKANTRQRRYAFQNLKFAAKIPNLTNRKYGCSFNLRCCYRPKWAKLSFSITSTFLSFQWRKYKSWNDRFNRKQVKVNLSLCLTHRRIEEWRYSSNHQPRH